MVVFMLLCEPKARVDYRESWNPWFDKLTMTLSPSARRRVDARLIRLKRKSMTDKGEDV